MKKTNATKQRREKASIDVDQIKEWIRSSVDRMV
jgi:hypothetical protein